jgi:hypothetical protein
LLRGRAGSALRRGRSKRRFQTASPREKRGPSNALATLQRFRSGCHGIAFARIIKHVTLERTRVHRRAALGEKSDSLVRAGANLEVENVDVII